jgi:hypothetical protein
MAPLFDIFDDASKGPIAIDQFRYFRLNSETTSVPGTGRIGPAQRAGEKQLRLRG